MGITHLSGLDVAGVPTMGIAGAPLFTGNWFFVDYVNGNDGNDGSATYPLQTIYGAYANMVSGNNDVAVIIGDGTTAKTQRLSTANAQKITSSATTGTVTWAKNACHIIGMTAPTGINERARFAPPTGTYTASTFGNSGNFFNVTATGCYFANFSLFNGFSTGSTGQICWIENGGHNYYNGVHFGGMGDSTSAGSATSASLKMTASSENTFVNCTFGLDTVQRTTGNASILFSGTGSARNKFIDCDFPMWVSTATTMLAVSAPTGTLDRWTKFQRCAFLNNVDSTSTTLTAPIQIGAAGGGPNGFVIFDNCVIAGATYVAYDATTAGVLYVAGGISVAATTGLAVVSTSHP